MGSGDDKLVGEEAVEEDLALSLEACRGQEKASRVDDAEQGGRVEARSSAEQTEKAADTEEEQQEGEHSVMKEFLDQDITRSENQGSSQLITDSNIFKVESEEQDHLGRTGSFR